MNHHGFVRVAAGCPALRVANCTQNAEYLCGLMTRAEGMGIALVIFPELCLTGYTCADLFQQSALQAGAIAGLEQVLEASSKSFSGVAVVGLPLAVDDQLFNCAAVVQRGRILGLVPKSFIPNYKEFYEGRWFSPAATARTTTVKLLDQSVPFSPNQLFEAEDVPGLVIGVEICEDLWVPIPPSSFQALHGATVLANLSASNEIIGKSNYRRQLVINQSGRCMAAYLYASCGVWESTTDVVFGGHCLIAENGSLLAESRRFQRDGFLLAADIDLDRLRVDRLRTNSFGDAHLYQRLDQQFTTQRFSLDRQSPPTQLLREVEAHPFVPRGLDRLRERCEEIFQIQVAGLAKRLEHTGCPPVAIGISGGLDSTLTLLVLCKTLDHLDVDRRQVRAISMPGFGTTSRTRSNAMALMQHLGVSASEVDIRSLCLEEMRAIGHRPFGIDLAGLSVDELAARLIRVPVERRQDVIFENIQARMRTSILFNSGFVIGTGDISELALGWCTYNGDHMSNYNPNVSIPKSLVKFLVRWAAENEFDGEARRILLDVVATEISPELLPIGIDDGIGHATENIVGPYELHDFFLFHFLRYGAPPEKILFLAGHASFERTYRPEEIRHWLAVFIRRFFGNQFKRSCLPDGPKVGTVSLSPRGDWRMPSDAQAALWLAWAEQPAESHRCLEPSGKV